MADYDVQAVKIAGASPADFVFNADHSRIFVAGSDGALSTYDARQGTLLGRQSVGVQLGAIDLSPDGKSLFITDTHPASFQSADPWWEDKTDVLVYQVDVATGAKTTFTYHATGDDYSFADLAAVTGNEVYFTDNILPGWSGAVNAVELDVSTGQFKQLNDIFYQGVLTANASKTSLLVGETGLSSARYVVYKPDVGEMFNNGIYQNGVEGPGVGVQAISDTAGLSGMIAFYTNGLFIYNEQLQFEENLSTAMPSLGTIAGLAFNDTGKDLYALDSTNDAIVQIDTSSLSVVNTFHVPDNITFQASSDGNELLIGPNDAYFLVATSNSLVRIDNPTATVGTSASETLTAHIGAETLTGNGGNDTFRGSAAEINSDTITDFSVGDRLSITDAAFADLTYARSGTSLTIGSDATVMLAPAGARLALAADGNATDLVAVNHWTELSDFNGDGHSDLFWQNQNGAVSSWAVAGNQYGNQVTQAAFNAGVATSWHATDTLDWNGDGRSDILWRNDDGSLAIWRAQDGGFDQASYFHGSVGTDWRVAGVGDLDGDGKDDLLWQNANGSISAWTSTGTGFAENTYSHGSPGSTWKVDGLGDFNGDGKADILWRGTDGGVSTWLSSASGLQEGSFYQPGVPTSWRVAGVGDFDGDGRDDILWRNDNGAVSVWRSNGNGFDQAVYNTTVGTDWHIAAEGDYNDDGRADILWRNDNGAVSTWQSNGSGFDQSIYNSAADTSWHVVAHGFVG